jgi:squalene-hopene/tetraprenyl-beta-curcumene cyclase
MRRLFAPLATLLMALPMIAGADDPTVKSADVPQAIDRGVSFLAKDAVAWRDEQNCVSCHHAGMVVWSMNEARRRGHSVDEPLLEELTTWIAQSGDGRSSLERPASAPKALNTKALWFSLALASVPGPGDEVRKGLNLVLETLKSDQTETGAWESWPETRAPMFGHSDYSTTALAAMALVVAAPDDQHSQSVLDKAVKWLDGTQPDHELQSVSMKLAIVSRLKRPISERQPLIDLIRHCQHDDGGWGQNADLPSDAWATGQALYALSLAGVDSANDSIQRGQQFLVKNQRADGSWPMTSRPTKPGGEGSRSLVPIIGAGSAWAVIGLVNSSAEAKR